MGSPRRLRVHREDDLAGILGADSGLRSGPVLVLVGGAAGLDADDEERLLELFSEHLLPAVVRCGAGIVDGGTNFGVMRVVGAARLRAGMPIPLVGVAAERTVRWPEEGGDADAAMVDANHSHIVLVPGESWGDESPWLSAVARTLAGRHASVTLLVNGGEIAYEDVHHSLASGRPVVVLAGSGRTADVIASALVDPDTDERAARIAASPLVRFVWLDAPETVAATISALLTRSDGDR